MYYLVTIRLRNNQEKTNKKTFWCKLRRATLERLQAEDRVVDSSVLRLWKYQNMEKVSFCFLEKKKSTKFIMGDKSKMYNLTKYPKW